MSKKLKILCIIPAFNEEKNIVGTIKNVKLIVNEVVVVDDGSSDETFNLAQKQKITVLKHIINRGQGAALQTGNKYALMKNADIIVHFDADGQFLSEEIEDIIAPIKSGQADVVFGSRFLEKKSNIPWFKKYIIIKLAKIANMLFMGISLSDPQNGFRAMSSDAAKKIKIEHDGMAHCSEILYKVIKSNTRFKEIPTTVIYHNFGQKLSGGIKILKDLFLAKLIN